MNLLPLLKTTLLKIKWFDLSVFTIVLSMVTIVAAGVMDDRSIIFYSLFFLAVLIIHLVIAQWIELIVKRHKTKLRKL